jgi:hypothetical protein
MIMIAHYLDNRLTDGVDVVSLRYLPRSTPEKHRSFLSLVLISVSGAHFCSKLSKSQGLLWPEGLGKLKEKAHSGQ